MKEMEIQATSVQFECVGADCSATQEVDILGKNQIAEAKSATAANIDKKGSKQARHYRQIQEQLFGAGTKPRGKLDASRTDVAETAEHFSRRGHQVEQVSGFNFAL